MSKKFIYIVSYSTALKLASDNNKEDILNYLLSLPSIEIVPNCFIDCKNLKNILIPSSVTTLGKKSFSGCINLKEITIPSSVTNIDSYAFENCVKLEEMIVPSYVSSIGDYFVSGCYSLKTIIIPKTLKQIGKIDFQNFSQLKEISIPSCVEYIEDSLFNNCTSLMKVEIPPSVNEIREKAFFGCTSLVTINIPSAKYIRKYAFAECTSLVEVTISSTVESIANNAFQGCKSLSKIMITNPVKSLPKIEMISNPLLIKVVLVGAAGVGKSCILEMLLKNRFNPNQYITVSSVYSTKDYDIDGNDIRLIIWDTAGFDRYFEFTKSYFRSANCFVVIFDLCCHKTFEDVKKYFDDSHLEKYPSFQILMGNKFRNCEISVSDEEIREMEHKYNAKYFEVSACYGQNINEAFEYIARESFTSISEETNKLQNLINNNKIDDENNENKRQKNCTIS